MNAETRVGETQSEISVVRQDHEAFGIGIEAPGGIHPDGGGCEFDHRRAALRVICSAHRPDGLVHEIRGEIRGEWQRQAIDVDPLFRWIDLLTEMGRFSVDRDTTLADEDLGVSSRRVSRPGDQLLESFDDPSGRNGRSRVSTISAGGT